MASPHGGYYTSHLSQDYQDELCHEDDVEVENEVKEVSPRTGMTSESKIKGQSKNFSEEEDKLLVFAWLNVCQDPVDGNQQKKCNFLGIEFRCIIMNIGHSSWSSLKNRWGTIKKEVSIFQGFHESIERRNESSKTSNDKANIYLFYFLCWPYRKDLISFHVVVSPDCRSPRCPCCIVWMVSPKRRRGC
jgi:hypothetical protein